LPWEWLVDAATAARPSPSWLTDGAGSYSLWTGWSVLGVLLAAIDRRPLPSLLKQDVLEPFGMRDSWIGMPASTYRAYGHCIARTTDLRPGRGRWQELREGETACERCSPADGGRGPAHDLGRLYEGMLAAVDGCSDALSRATATMVLTASRDAHSPATRRHQ